MLNTFTAAPIYATVFTLLVAALTIGIALGVQRMARPRHRRAQIGVQIGLFVGSLLLVGSQVGGIAAMLLLLILAVFLVITQRKPYTKIDTQPPSADRVHSAATLVIPHPTNQTGTQLSPVLIEQAPTTPELVDAAEAPPTTASNPPPEEASLALPAQLSLHLHPPVRLVNRPTLGKYSVKALKIKM